MDALSTAGLSPPGRSTSKEQTVARGNAGANRVLIDRSRIRELIPHAGTMCLLDGVQAWDESAILCVSSSHRFAPHPLRRDGSLSAIYGVELAAQAMALHCALGAGQQGARAGYLVALRDVTCRVDELDALPGDLLVQAQRMQGDGTVAIYRFAVQGVGEELVAGRATVKLAAMSSRA